MTVNATTLMPSIGVLCSAVGVLVPASLSIGFSASVVYAAPMPVVDCAVLSGAAGPVYVVVMPTAFEMRLCSGCSGF